MTLVLFAENEEELQRVVDEFYSVCPFGGGYKNSTSVVPVVHERQQKGQSEESGKQRGREGNVFLNPNVPCLGHLPLRG